MAKTATTNKKATKPKATTPRKPRTAPAKASAAKKPVRVSTKPVKAAEPAKKSPKAFQLSRAERESVEAVVVNKFVELAVERDSAQRERDEAKQQLFDRTAFFYITVTIAVIGVTALVVKDWKASIVGVIGAIIGAGFGYAAAQQRYEVK